VKRLAWVSNSPTVATAYGQQTAQVVSRLGVIDVEAAVVSTWGQQGVAALWNGIPVYPNGFHDFSHDTIGPWISDWRADLVVTLWDVYGLPWDAMPEIPTFAWTPVDHDPLPPLVAQALSRSHVTPVAMSKWGLGRIRDAGGNGVYIPHAVEEVMFDGTDEQAAEVREGIGVPADAFLVGMVAANRDQYDRKGFQQAFEAVARVQATNPDVWFYLHTDTAPDQGGMDLASLLVASGVDLSRVRTANRYQLMAGVPQAQMAALYRSLDTLISPSRGEGFGLPVLESQAAGCRVVVSDFSAQPELVGDGVAVGTERVWDPYQHSWWVTARVGELTDAILGMVDAGQKRSEVAVEFARGYEAQTVFDRYWVPLLG